MILTRNVPPLGFCELNYLFQPTEPPSRGQLLLRGPISVEDILALTFDLTGFSWPTPQQGLPYAFGKLGMRAKVYATLPVWKMGQMAVYDAYLSRTHEGNFQAFDLDDVDAAFAKFKTLKFSQHLTFSVSERASGRLVFFSFFCCGGRWPFGRSSTWLDCLAGGVLCSAGPGCYGSVCCSRQQH